MAMGCLPNCHGCERGSGPGAGVLLPVLEERQTYKFQGEIKD